MATNIQFVNLSDDELWRAIAQNTETVSALYHQLDADIRATNPGGRANVRFAYAEVLNKFQHEYRKYTAELRRRYP